MPDTPQLAFNTPTPSWFYPEKVMFLHLYLLNSEHSCASSSHKFGLTFLYPETFDIMNACSFCPVWYVILSNEILLRRVSLVINKLYSLPGSPQVIWSGVLLLALFWSTSASAQLWVLFHWRDAGGSTRLGHDPAEQGGLSCSFEGLHAAQVTADLV